MNNFWILAGIGLLVFMSFAGGALFYWVLSKRDKEDKKKG